MQVIIIEKATNRVVATVPVTLRGFNYTLTNNEWFDQGWQAAVEDNLVDANQRVKYSFEIKR